MVTRADLFLQTKFTYHPGQGHRLPYDPAADLSTQDTQSMASSLEHLGTDHVDSYVLHGPASGSGWTDDDAEVWDAMVKERDAGRTRLLGVSNVLLRHLEQMAAAAAEAPAFVQNRCFARFGWDRDVRSFCRDRKIVYQGFSLLTANPKVLRHPLVAGLAARGKKSAEHERAFFEALRVAGHEVAQVRLGEGRDFEAAARATAEVCADAPVDGARSPPRGSGLTCPARSDRIGARCHGSSAL